MRPFIFTTALPPVSVAWSLFVMKRLADFDERRVHLQAISVRLRNALEKLGFTTESNSQIVPWILGESEVAMDSSLRLQRLGFYALPVRPPTVPVGSSRIRFSLSAALTDGEMTHLVEALPHCILSSSL